MIQHRYEYLACAAILLEIGPYLL